MKKILLFLLFFAFVVSFAKAANPRIQFINNSPDTSFQKVDISIGDSLVANDLSFRSATPYLDYPYDTTLTITFTPLYNSGIYTITLPDINIDSNKVYVCMITGVGDSSLYDANPSGTSIGLKATWMDVTTRSNPNIDSVTLFVAHGATDVPIVDANPLASAKLINDLPYGEIREGSYDLFHQSYNIMFWDEDSSVLISSFNIKLDTIGGQTAVIFLSGFLSPVQNQNGPDFGVYIVYENGVVKKLANVTPVFQHVSSIIDLKISPNPANEKAMLSFFAENDANIHILIYDINGGLVKTITGFQAVKGKNTLNIPLDNLATGQYFIKIQDNKGAFSTAKLVVGQ